MLKNCLLSKGLFLSLAVLSLNPLTSPSWGMDDKNHSSYTHSKRSENESESFKELIRYAEEKHREIFGPPNNEYDGISSDELKRATSLFHLDSFLYTLKICVGTNSMENFVENKLTESQIRTRDFIRTNIGKFSFDQLEKTFEYSPKEDLIRHIRNYFTIIEPLTIEERNTIADLLRAMIKKYELHALIYSKIRDVFSKALPNSKTE